MWQALGSLLPGWIRSRYWLKFALVVGITALLIGGIGIAATQAVTTNVKQSIQDEYRFGAIQDAERLETWISRNEQVVRSVSDSPTLAWEGKAPTKPSPDTYLNRQTSHQGLQAEDDFLVVNPKSGGILNQSVSNIGRSSGSNFYTDGNGEWLRNVSFSGPHDTFVSAVFESYTRKHMIGFASPIPGVSDRVLVWLVERPGPGFLNGREMAANGSYTVVVNDDRDIILHETNGYRLFQTYPKSTVPIGSNQSGGMTVPPSTEMNTRHVIGYAPVERLNWTVLVHAPTSEAYGLVSAGQRYGWIATLAGVILMTLIVGVMGKQTSATLKELEAAVGQIKEGNFAVELQSNRTDSIGHLYRGIDSMRETIQAQITESTLVESSSDLITVLDTDSTITYQSPSSDELIGYKPETMLGQQFLTYVDEPNHKAIRNALEKCQKNPDTTERVEYRLRTADGEWRIFEGACENFLDDPFVEGFVLSSRDITERKQREQQLKEAKAELEQSNERLERFASIVSHDLRNPLGIAKTYLGFARDTGDPDDFDAVAEAHERMEAMIENLLTSARAGQTIEEPQPVALATVADGAWEHAETGESTLDMTLPDNMEVSGDYDRLLHVFENLFRNAADHNDAPVTVQVGTLSGRAGFFIADDGVGIPEDKREVVFEYGHTTNDEGTGFGLDIVEDIIEAHGWTITVTESDAGGARFDITGIDTQHEEQR
jgi:PAS domain S-box-containing protein